MLRLLSIFVKIKKSIIMSKQYLWVTFLFVAIFTFNSCKKDDPVIVDPPELITSLNYTLTPSGGGDAITLTFQDLDGDGGNDPIIYGGTLAVNEIYTGSLELLNESVTPSEDITEEIEEDDEDHQFFFQTDVTGLSVTYNDQDADGNPVGLASTVSTGIAASGMLTVILRHQPDKEANGVSDGSIDLAGGETDIEVQFPINVQ